jgi:hypothetical protein
MVAMNALLGVTKSHQLTQKCTPGAIVRPLARTPPHLLQGVGPVAVEDKAMLDHGLAQLFGLLPITSEAVALKNTAVDGTVPLALMLASGADIAVVSKLMGHASISVTSDVYGHMVGTIGRRLLTVPPT